MICANRWTSDALPIAVVIALEIRSNEILRRSNSSRRQAGVQMSPSLAGILISSGSSPDALSRLTVQELIARVLQLKTLTTSNRR